jgi:hypothetical protein
MPPQVAHSLKVACASCHADATRWPWYAYLPGTSYLIQRDVAQARAHLNFSDWQAIEKRGSEETAAAYSGICENLLSGAMPKRRYVLVHPEARLSQSETDAVCSWSQAEAQRALSASGK